MASVIEKIRLLKKWGTKMEADVVSEKTIDQVVADYWTETNVTCHKMFKTAQESLDYFHWRSEIYIGYLERMPVHGQDDKVVLDFGCGPGHDLVGFSVYSKPARLIGMDVSSASLMEARARLTLHKSNCEFIQLNPDSKTIPLEDASVDYIHSSGVLHHVPDLLSIMKELRRILKPNGKCSIMVYNYDSILLHLFVAYQKMLLEGEFKGMTVRQGFAKVTDGPNCPISNVYKPEEFMSQVSLAGFDTKFTGVAVSAYELGLLQKYRYDAIWDQRLHKEHRDFLLDLEFDAQGIAYYNGVCAGVDGCYELIPI